MSITTVSLDYLNTVIDNRVPRGKFLAQEKKGYVAVDNTTGDAWTEDFRNEESARRWLNNEFEVNGQAST